MPPKIRGMTANSSSSTAALRRLTLMLSGEDSLDDQDAGDQPRKGLPHERYLLGERVPLAPVLLLGQSDQAVDPEQNIACLQPVHLHATRDHLILMGQNQIDLTKSETDELLNAARPFIEEDFGHSILFHDQHFWFIAAGPFESLASYSIDQAHGRNIDWWMPRDTQEEGVAKIWRKLQNEIQMLWHIDPVNEAREARGLPSINSLWISGIGKLADVKMPAHLSKSQQIYSHHPLMAGLAKHAHIPFAQDVDLKGLANAFVWSERPDTLWPHLQQALEQKQLDEVLIIDFPHGKTRERIFTAKSLNKKTWAFWKKTETLTWKEIISS